MVYFVQNCVPSSTLLIIINRFATLNVDRTNFKELGIEAKINFSTLNGSHTNNTNVKIYQYRHKLIDIHRIFLTNFVCISQLIVIYFGVLLLCSLKLKSLSFTKVKNYSLKYPWFQIQFKYIHLRTSVHNKVRDFPWFEPKSILKNLPLQTE